MNNNSEAILKAAIMDSIRKYMDETIEEQKMPAPISNLQIQAYLDSLKDRIARRYEGSPLDQDYAYGMEIVYFDLIDLIEGKK
jgi:hypothetical protein